MKRIISVIVCFAMLFVGSIAAGAADSVVCDEHNWGEIYVYLHPTTNSVGHKARMCSECRSFEIVAEIPMLEIKYGDCDMSDKINLSDVSSMLKYIAKWGNLYFSPENADVTHDGKVNLSDATKILRYITGAYLYG